jgi:hypothetical protein
LDPAGDGVVGPRDPRHAAPRRSGAPVTLLGLHLGSRRFLLAPPEEFRRLAILLLAALAVLGLARAAL